MIEDMKLFRSVMNIGGSLILSGFGAVAILISFLLLFLDKKKGYGLQKPNVK